MTSVLHASIPDDWRPYSGPDVVVVARPPVDSGWFCTTLLLARDELPIATSLSELLDATRSSLDDLGDEVEVVGQRYAVDVDHERVSRLVCFDPPRAPLRVAQLQCLIARQGIGGQGTRSVAQFVGTCAFDELDRYGPAFVQVVDSIRFVEAQAGDEQLITRG